MTEQMTIKQIEQECVLLNQDEVSKILGVSTKTLEYWRWQKVGPDHVKLGKLVRYLKVEIEEFIRHLAAGGSVY